MCSLAFARHEWMIEAHALVTFPRLRKVLFISELFKLFSRSPAGNCNLRLTVIEHRKFSEGPAA